MTDENGMYTFTGLKYAYDYKVSIWDDHLNQEFYYAIPGRMYSLGEVNFIQGMHDFGNPKSSVGLKPIAVRLRQTEHHQRLEFPP